MMSAKLRILLLEDEPNDAELEIAELEEAGYECQWDRVDTRDSFLERLKEGTYDLLISDYALPDFDGLTALKLMQENRVDLPFILVSGTLGEEVAIESLKAGATDYVLKSRLSRLAPVVKRALKESTESQQCRQAEEALAIAAQFPSENPYPVLRVGKDGMLHYANMAAMKLLKSLDQSAHGRVPDDWCRCVASAMASGHVVCQEFVYDKATFALRFVPLQNGLYVNIYGLDITEQKNMESQFRQAQKMQAVGQLAGGVAHDFNNILQAILGYGEMAQDLVAPDVPARECIDQMMKAGHRAKMLISQLLAFSRQQVLQMEDLNLNDVIADLMKMLRRVIGEHVFLDVMPGHGLGTVRADRGQMGQVLTNLCVNARDAMPEGGTITIETENVRIDEEYCMAHSWATPGRYVLLSVTDTGCGMDVETTEQVFEPFFTTKAVGKGTGLGLATVYGLVKQHSGSFEVYSELNKGSTFKIYLPVVERAAKVVGSKIDGPVPGGHETILLAEDDEIVREVCQEMLEKAGYVVLLAEDGEEALRLVDEGETSIDLALLDVVMPNLGGRAVYDQLRRRRSNIRVVFASGYSTNAVHTNFILDENLDLLQKPYQRAALLRKVREVLDR